MTAYTLFADGEPPQPADQKPAESPLGIFGNPLFMIGLLALAFFVFVLPAQRRRKREEAAMQAALKPGAKVVLASGIVGVVATVHEAEGELTIRSADAKVRVLRTAVVSIKGDDAPAATTEAKS